MGKSTEPLKTRQYVTAETLTVVRVFSLDMPLGSNRVRQQSPVMSDRSGYAQQQGIIRCRAGVGGQGSHEAMESPKALMCPLEKGVRGIETGHQMPGRSWRAG